MRQIADYFLSVGLWCMAAHFAYETYTYESLPQDGVRYNITDTVTPDRKGEDIRELIRNEIHNINTVATYMPGLPLILKEETRGPIENVCTRGPGDCPCCSFWEWYVRKICDPNGFVGVRVRSSAG